ncbi:hypothetical protein MKW92_049356 [Papaver armeniacum]|nr:hypothetical protein MKW92_049356 [Papaver armeniacum]
MLIYVLGLDGRTSSAHVSFSPRSRFNFTGLGGFGGPFSKWCNIKVSSLKTSCKSNVSRRKQRRIMISTT